MKGLNVYGNLNPVERRIELSTKETKILFLGELLMQPLKVKPPTTINHISSTEMLIIAGKYCTLLKLFVTLTILSRTTECVLETSWLRLIVLGLKYFVIFITQLPNSLFIALRAEQSHRVNEIS